MQQAPRPRSRWLAPALAGLLLTAFALELALGASGWSWPLVRQLRLPRALAAAGCGALLAQAGLALQLLLRNPLADPYVLGAASGAGFGATLLLLSGASLLWPGGVLGAAAALLLLLLLGRRALAQPGDEAAARLVLLGAMLSALFAALTTLLLILVPEAALRGAMFWLLGDLSGAGAGWALCVLAGLLVLPGLRLARALDRLALGAELAWLLGEPVHRLRLGLLLLAAVATGAVVAQAGAIGFVGLVVPHALRRLGVHDMRRLSWAAPLLGASLLLLADAVARGLWPPYELPVGALTALLGAPLFIALLRGGRR